MNFEIEFHPVGDKSKAGDAITVRYQDGPVYKVMVVDGGTDDSGQAVVDHIQQVYGRHTTVSDVVCTHPDSDHACGLRKILEQVRVERLWVHVPWRAPENIVGLFDSERWTEAGLERTIRQAYPVVGDLLQLAANQGTHVYEPFAGAQIGPFVVLSPSEWVYERLVPQFRKTPEPDVDELKRQGMWLGAKKTAFQRLIEEALGIVEEAAAKAASKWIRESWSVEWLRDGGVTAAENESSVVLLGTFGADKVVLTGDAGARALEWACNYADVVGLDRSNPVLFQIPHHGSRRNVGPSILNRALGTMLPEGTPPHFYAPVSAPKDDTTHPREIVLNAFRRRGAIIAPTQGSRFRFSRGMPPRMDEGPVAVSPIASVVEGYDD